MSLDLEGIKARCDAATPGEWRLLNPQPGSKTLHFTGPDGLTLDYDDVEPNRQLHDGRFIAAARTDVPALVAEVERLTAEHSMWRDHFDGKHGADLSHPLCHHCLSVRANDACDAAQRALAAAQADAARLRAALRAMLPTIAVRSDITSIKVAQTINAALATPAGDEALREFGLKVATHARKVHATFGGSQVDAVAIVDAVLRGER